MYSGEPHNVSAMEVSSKWRANPKSAIFKVACGECSESNRGSEKRRRRGRRRRRGG